jgi:hypothetical protein
VTLQELKDTAGKEYTTIRRDEPTAPAVSLKDWNGFSSFAGGPTSLAAVSYELEGNRVRVRKTLEGEYWYILG